MPEPLRSAWAKFWQLVDGDSVRPFIWLYYAPLFAFGIFATTSLPLDVLRVILGPLVVDSWIWVQIPATAAALIGLALRHGGTPIAQMGSLLLFRDWIGLGMQFGGHACMCLVLLAFEVAAWTGPLWWLFAMPASAMSSYVIGCAVLCLQVARKIWRGTQLRQAVR